MKVGFYLLGHKSHSRVLTNERQVPLGEYLRADIENNARKCWGINQIVKYELCMWHSAASWVCKMDKTDSISRTGWCLEVERDLKTNSGRTRRTSISDIFIHDAVLSKSWMPFSGKAWLKKNLFWHLFSVICLGLLDPSDLVLSLIFGFIVCFFFTSLINHVFFHWHEPETMSLGTAWNVAVPGVQRHALVEPVDQTQNASRYQITFHSPPGGLVLAHGRCH